MKGPPTGADLLQMGKAESLDKIISLDLSRRSLARLDVDLFNQLSSLQTLDISQNMLTSIPDDLRLPKLRVLDCSDNQLTSIEFVKSFGKLSELYVEDNDDITTDDHYIAKLLCPSLRSIDGGADLQHVQKGIQLYNDQLKPSIEAVWEARFGDVYKDSIPVAEMASLHKEFVDTIRNTEIVGANLTCLKFKAFMIGHICWKLLESVNSGGVRQGRRSSKPQGDSDTPSTPGRYGTRVASGTTPVKDYSTGAPIDKGQTPADPASSKKRKREATPTDTPPQAKRKKEKHETPAFTILKPATDMMVTQLPQLDDYDPLLFVRCHSMGNHAGDGNTKIWKCAFEPFIGSKHGETTNIVATCGGNIVCLVDCQTGKVIKRYKDSNKEESFYALSWTTLPADGQQLKEPVNLLAVAGQAECIKLIHPTQLVMFGALVGHRGYISSLVFHPARPNILFSSSRDNRIIMWEIGTPDFQNFSIKWSQLAVLRPVDTDAITMVIQPGTNLLVAGCEISCYAWDIDKIKMGRKAGPQCPDYEFLHPVEDESEEETTVDGLALLPGNCLLSKCVGHSRLYVWDAKDHIATVKPRSKVHPVKLTPLIQLQYSPVDVDYLYPSACKGIVTVGDHKGNIYMYNVAPAIKQHRLKDSLQQSSRELAFPELVVQKDLEEKMSDVTDTKDDVVINCVALSSSGEYLACGTDNNLIGIWKQAQL